MTAPERLRLRAEDDGDLAVISACLQDAVFAVGEMAFVPADERFAAIAVRRCRREAGGPAGQAAAAIRFDAVSAVRQRGIDRAQPTRLLRLAGIVAEPGRHGAVIRLLFESDAEVWLEADRLDCRLEDLEEPHAAFAGEREAVS